MSEEKKWYSLRVISGKERKIKERIELEIQRSKWSDAVTQVLVLGLVETEEISDSSFCGSGNLGTELSDQRTG